jgi:flagellar biogenesis protein FliO
MRILLLMLVISCVHAAVADAVFAQPAAIEVPADIPYKKDPGHGSGSFLKAIIVMGLLLSLAGGALFLVKRSAIAGKLGIAEAKFIKLVELKRLSPKLNVYLLEVHGRQYLLAQAGESLSIVEHTASKGPGNGE